MPIYARLLNTKPKEALGWHKPYEMFYGRKYGSATPTNQQNVVAIHRNIRKVTAAYNTRYVQKQLKQRKVQSFSIGEKVFHRFSKRPSGVPISNKVIPAKVMKRNVKHSTYKIKFINPNTKLSQEKWVCVSALAQFKKNTHAQVKRITP